MNSNTLLKEIQRRLVSSGISDLVTEFVRDHPEYWTENNTMDGVNTCCQIGIAYNSTPKFDVTSARPFFTIDIGRVDKTLLCMSFHPDTNAQYTDYWNNFKKLLSHKDTYDGPRLDA